MFISLFYTGEELVQAIVAIHGVCVKLLDDGSTPRIINWKGDNKRRMDVEDILKFITLLEGQAVQSIFCRKKTFVVFL